MISEEVLDAMLASGCSAQQIVEAVKADLRADEAKKVLRRQGNRERQRTRRTRLRAAKDRPVTSVTRLKPFDGTPQKPTIDRGRTPLPGSTGSAGLMSLQTLLPVARHHRRGVGSHRRPMTFWSA